MTIERIETLAKEPRAVYLALEALNGLRLRGCLEECCCGANWHSHALLAVEDGESIGLIIYQTVDWKNKLDLEIGYVRPDRRRAGVYRALWDELIGVAREKGIPVISGATHVDNQEMQAVMSRLDRQLKWLTYEYRLTP